MQSNGKIIVSNKVFYGVIILLISPFIFVYSSYYFSGWYNKRFNVESYSFNANLSYSEENLEIAREYFAQGLFHAALVYYDHIPERKKTKALFDLKGDVFSEEDKEKYQICKILDYARNIREGYDQYLKDIKALVKQHKSDKFQLNNYSNSSQNKIDLTNSTVFKDYIYKTAIWIENSTTNKYDDVKASEYENVVKLYKFIGEYKDSKIRMNKCMSFITNYKAKNNKRR